MRVDNVLAVLENIDDVAFVSRGSQGVQSSAPVKLVDEVMRVADSMDFTPVGSLVKFISSVAFGVKEDSGGLVGCLRHAKLRKFNLGSSTGIMRSPGVLIRKLVCPNLVLWLENVLQVDKFGHQDSLLKL